MHTFNSLTPAQLRTLCVAMKDGVVLHDRTGKIIHYNPAALSILGLDENQLLGKTSVDPQWKAVREDLSPMDGESHPASVALRTGSPQIDQIMGIQRASGELRWLEICALPVGDDDLAKQVLVTFRDVTKIRAAIRELEATQTRLVASETFLNVTLSSLPCLVSYLDQDFVYRYANQTYRRWFGLSPEQIVGKHLHETVGVTALEQLKPFLDQALLGYEQHFEKEMPYKSGDPRHVQVTYLPDRAPDGAIRGIYCIIQDISTQVRLSRFAEEKASDLQKLIDGVPAMIGYWDQDLRSVYANRAYADYFGELPRSLKGLHIKDVIGPALFEKDLPYLLAALQGRRQTFERTIPLAGGGERETLATYIPNFENDEVVGLFVVVSDITQIKTLERERRQMEAKLVASSKLSSIGQMAGGIAHEINNPLAIISGIASSLGKFCDSREFDPNEVRARLAKLESTVRRAASIIQGLRAFAGEADHEIPAPRELGELIGETLGFCHQRFMHYGIAVQVVGVPHRGARIECRSVQISQILLNLLNNSFDAVQTLADRWVRIDVVMDDRSVILRVTDSGEGIPPELAEKVMEPFVTTKPVGKGTGLGLSISKGLAESNNGSLRYVASSPHTCFELVLPLAATR